MSFRSAVVGILTGVSLLAGVRAPLGAQEPKKEVEEPRKGAQEFTKQGLLIVNFAPSKGSEMKLGRKAGDAVRSRVGKLLNKREVEVIEGGEIEYRMLRAGYNPDTVFTVADIKAIGEFLRADEYIMANVASGPAGPTISGELVLMRDDKLRQRLPTVTARDLDSAATLFAKAVAAARLQLAPERRCENGLREKSVPRAIASAREGITAYPRSVIARTCLVWAQQQAGTPATEVLKTAREILAIDSNSVHGIEAAAIALDSLHRRDEAATHWLRLGASDTTNVELALRVSFAMVYGGNSVRAEPFISAMADSHPDESRLLQQKWRVSYENKSWARAIAAGELLLQRDSTARTDSSFYLKLGMAYRSYNKPYKAIETLAHGVAAFPADSRLYSLYAQYIKAEADTVVPRGLAMFPRSADLLAVNAKDLRSRGKIEESLKSTKMAVEIDSSIRQGHLMVAQLELQMARPDSALSALRRGIAGGEDSTLVAQFALGEGNTLYRAANGTKTTKDFTVALQFLAYADSIRSSPQSRFLTGAAALAVAQGVITDGTKQIDKAVACKMVREGSDLLPVARSGLSEGGDTFAEAAKPSLEYLGRLDTYAQTQVRLLCTEPPKN